MFIIPDDFKGKYALSLNIYSTEKMLLMIDEIEKKYLVKLLGKSLYDEFIADLDVDNLPQSSHFIQLFNSFQMDKDCEILESQGILNMLKGFFYFEFIRFDKTRHTNTGVVKNANENSTQTSDEESLNNLRYNESISTFLAIQYYIEMNKEQYQSYNGQKLRKIFFGGAF